MTTSSSAPEARDASWRRACPPILSVSVLLLEAGPADDADEIHAPAALSRLFQGPYDWNYQTVPQHRAAGRSIYWPRGKVLGGSSSMNAMIYIRGSRHDFASWRDEHGCAGWGYQDLMPYFRRAEDNSRGASAYHGTGGPLSVTDPRYKSAACAAFIAAAQEQGAVANDDFNGPRQDGVGWYQLTQRNGRRCSAATAYLHPAMSRPNLTVLTDALVTKVIVEDGQATGVTLPAARRAGQRAGRRRGHPVRRRGQQPAAADAVRHRPGRRPDRDGHRRAGGQPGRRRQPVRPSGAAGDLVHAAAARPVGEERQRGRAALAADPPRPGDVQRGGVRRLRPLRTWAARAGPAAARAARALPRPGSGRPAQRAMSVLVGLVDVASRGRIRLRSDDPRHRPAIDPGYLSDPGTPGR
jgi:choline dehydrogenase